MNWQWIFAGLVTVAPWLAWWYKSEKFQASETKYNQLKSTIDMENEEKAKAYELQKQTLKNLVDTANSNLRIRRKSEGDAE